MVTYKLPIGQKEDENWAVEISFFFKGVGVLKCPPPTTNIIAHLSSPAAGHAWEGAIRPDYGR